jgi:hypothetical protein
MCPLMLFPFSLDLLFGHAGSVPFVRVSLLRWAARINARSQSIALPILITQLKYRHIP